MICKAFIHQKNAAYLWTYCTKNIIIDYLQNNQIGLYNKLIQNLVPHQYQYIFSACFKNLPVDQYQSTFLIIYSCDYDAFLDNYYLKENGAIKISFVEYKRFSISLMLRVYTIIRIRMINHPYLLEMLLYADNILNTQGLIDLNQIITQLEKRERLQYQIPLFVKNQYYSLNFFYEFQELQIQYRLLSVERNNFSQILQIIRLNYKNQNQRNQSINSFNAFKSKLANQKNQYNKLINNFICQIVRKSKNQRNIQYIYHEIFPQEIFIDNKEQSNQPSPQILMQNFDHRGYNMRNVEFIEQKLIMIDQ